MPYKPVNSIEVLCWGQPVGALALDARYGVYAFEYYEAHRRSGLELSPLLLPLSEQGAKVFPSLSRETFYGLPAFIADSLPDSFGNMLINGWMAAHGVSWRQVTALDRLAYMGTRAMGALEFRPALRDGDVPPSALEMGSLVETARQALSVRLGQDSQNPEIGLAGQLGAVDGPPGFGSDRESDPSENALQQLVDISTSAGGARAKAVVGYHEQADAFVSGQFGLPPGYGHWIIKFDLSPATPSGGPCRQAYGRIEYAYYLMACDMGIDMHPCRLYEAAGRAHFMARRFDRTPEGGKLHMQTLCALGGLDFNVRDAHDYHQAFMAAEEIGLGYTAADELFRRMVFNVAMANNDDHTKNLSFLMTPDGAWSLAPAYDLTHAYSPDSPWVSRHLMAVNGKFSNIERHDLMVLARRYRVSAPGDIIDAALAAAARWPRYAEKAQVPPEKAQAIAHDIERCTQPLG
ncbi:MAG: type II toxin-antitoxin system HipA family toxin [Coriobacteriaceae bacterium]|jgi:serine/threonine-protein kinase HipA|nr:type II toxin-antitoxin system HipA family toxin [Coriobacteriaceae bacterium]